MTDGSAPDIQANQLPTERVAVGKDRLGVVIKDEGASYDLGNTFRKSADMLGGDKFTDIYFRTRSGNIYRLEDRGKGVLTNANVSAERGNVVSDEFDRESLEKRPLVIGQPLVLVNESGRLQTTRISEIVATTSRRYNPDYLLKTTQGRANSIIDEFDRKISGLPRRRPSPEPPLPGKGIMPRPQR